MKKLCVSIMSFMIFSLSLGAQEEKKTDFVYDLIRASYFAETYVDLGLSSILSGMGYEDMNPIYNLYMDKPVIALTITQISNALVYALTDEIFYYFQMQDKEYIAYIMVVALLLAKTYATYHNLKAFQ